MKAMHRVFEVLSDQGSYTGCCEYLKKIKQGTLSIDPEYKLSTMLYLLKQALKQERPDSVIDLFIHDTEVEANFVFIIIEHLL